MKHLLVAASVVLACTAHAAREDYAMRTAGDLARLCATPASASDASTAIAFCHGVLAGAYGYFEASTPAADRFVCSPTPRPTRTQVSLAFVDWMKTRPQFNNDGAIDALFRFAAEAYPCKR